MINYEQVLGYREQGIAWVKVKGGDRERGNDSGNLLCRQLHHLLQHTKTP